MGNTYDVIIVGGGAAGSAAATYLASHRHQTLLIDKGILGGFLGSLGRVFNFPGFPEPISGTEIINRLRRQAEKMGAKFATADIKNVSFENDLRQVKTENETFEARSIILCTGFSSRSGYTSGEREFVGRGVSHSAHLDGPSVTDQIIAVIGKNKQSAEEALFLSKFANKIHFFIPSNRLDIDNSLLAELQNEKKIELLYSTSPKSINGQERVNSVTVFMGGQEKEIPVATVFAYTHEYQPTTQYLKDSVKLSENGSVMVDEDLQTSAPGVFACGDILCAKPQIPAISLAQGLLAGINADRYLIAKK